MFNEAALALRAHLIDAIQKVRDTLDEHLENVAKKVCHAPKLVPRRAGWLLDTSRFFNL